MALGVSAGGDPGRGTGDASAGRLSGDRDQQRAGSWIAETLERLDSFVRAGGGLWLALARRAIRRMFNRDWYSDGDGLARWRSIRWRSSTKADDVAATIHPPSRDHPATVQLANTTQLDIDEARLRQHWTFAERGADQEAVSALLESGNGQPLVVEKYVGQGRVLVQAFPLGLEWSNLPLLKAYVVMVHDWLGLRHRADDVALQPRAGESDRGESAGGNAAARRRSWSRRAGGRSRSSAADAEFAPVFRYSQTTLPGTYRVRFKDGDATVGEVPYQVARDAAESDLKMLGAGPAGEVGGLVRRAVRRDGGADGNGDDGGGRAAARAGLGRAVGGALVLLVAELFLANLHCAAAAGV